jgi:hypothetical protein
MWGSRSLTDYLQNNGVSSGRTAIRSELYVKLR